jgi:hypothetical protein
MRRTVAVLCLVALCTGVVLASAGLKSTPTEANGLETSAPMAQAEAGAGFLLELSTVGLLGVGAVSMFMCRKRKRL